MSYVGNTPADKFLTLEKQQFSVSATTGYTLSHSVSSPQDIALFINNVRQNPNSSYTVSNTALTLSSATSSGDTMYCVFLGKAIGTVGVPVNGVGTSQIVDNAVTSAKLASGAGGDPNLALSCSFSAYMNTAITNASINSLVSLPFDAEDFDLGNNFNTSTYTFTAPATGYYLFNTHVRLNTNDRSMDYIMLRLVTNALTYERNIWDPNAFYNDVTYWSMNSTDLIYLPSGNTISPKYYQGGGNAMVDIPSGASGARFSGMRVA